MAAVDLQFGVLPRFEGNRLLLLRDGRRGPDGAAEDHRHTVGNAAVDAAHAVGFGHHPAVADAEGIVCLTAAHIGKLKAVAKLHALDGGNGKERVRKESLHAVKPRLAQPCG